MVGVGNGGAAVHGVHVVVAVLESLVFSETCWLVVLIICWANVEWLWLVSSLVGGCLVVVGVFVVDGGSWVVVHACLVILIGGACASTFLCSIYSAQVVPLFPLVSNSLTYSLSCSHSILMLTFQLSWFLVWLLLSLCFSLFHFLFQRHFLFY